VVVEDLAGRVAVVTGAASGIGRALVHRCGAEGMAVVAADVEPGALEAVVGELRDAGVRAIGVRTDVSSSADVEHLADVAFGQLGRVDLLCNNAGVFQGGFLWERTDADLEWVLGVNVWGILHAIRVFVPRMLTQEHDSHIVNTASVAGLVSTAYSGPYVISKFAAVAATECLAHDLRAVGSRIGVSLLTPSAIATGIATSGRNRPEHLANPLGDSTPDAEFVAAALADSTAGGLNPTVVAGQVLDAVRAGRFVVNTNETYYQQVEERMQGLLARELPSVSVID
jgi:NAD(P)-dependent dehydrogenase (short-subunit alcohol dehydrogenase family)